MMFKKKPTTRLTIIRRAGVDRSDHNLVECQCSCGAVAILREYQVRTRKTLSCGCLQREAVSAKMKTHGMSNTKMFRLWAGMMGRCYTPSATRYERYGGRGIGVCKRWHTFENFYADMGDKPSAKHSLDRRDNNGDYTPDNCFWNTQQAQSENKSNSILVEHEGTSVCLKTYCKIKGLNYSTVRGRLAVGRTMQEALEMPLQKRWKDIKVSKPQDSLE